MTSRKQKPLLDKAQAAIRNNDAGAMAEVLRLGLDPNARLPLHDPTQPGDLLLAAVVKRGLYRSQANDMARVLIEHGASIGQVRDEGVAILDTALSCEDTPLVLFLIAQLDSLYHPNEPERYCGRIYETSVLAAMVSKGMRRDDVEQWAWEAVMDNTPEGPEVVRWMAEHGYSLDTPQISDGPTPLQSLLQNASGLEGEMAIIRAMVEHGACLEGIDTDTLDRRIPALSRLADDIRARQTQAALAMTTPSARAQRAARRV